MAAHPTAKNTKNEILKMYDELLQEKEQIETKMKQALQEKQTAEKRARDVVTSAQKSASGEEKTISQPTTLDQILDILAVLRPGFGDAVSELSAKLLAEASTLAELHRHVETETQQLAALHGLQATDGMLEQLIQGYLDKSAAFEAEITQRQEAFTQEMTQKRAAWKKEQEDHARLIKERDELAKKTRQREAAEYEYALQRQRKLEQDAYIRTQEELKKTLEDFETGKKKEWAERERQLAEQEKEYADLQAKVEKFPKELDAAVKRAREEGLAFARRQAQKKADLRAKEADGEHRLYELKIQSMENVIQKQVQQITSIATQRDLAIKQTQDLAVKAIEGASTAGSLQAVKEIALEQAKNVQKGK